MKQRTKKIRIANGKLKVGDLVYSENGFDTLYKLPLNRSRDKIKALLSDKANGIVVEVKRKVITIAY